MDKDPTARMMHMSILKEYSRFAVTLLALLALPLAAQAQQSATYRAGNEQALVVPLSSPRW